MNKTTTPRKHYKRKKSVFSQLCVRSRCYFIYPTHKYHHRFLSRMLMPAHKTTSPKKKRKFKHQKLNRRKKLCFHILTWREMFTNEWRRRDGGGDELFCRYNTASRWLVAYDVCGVLYFVLHIYLDFAKKKSSNGKSIFPRIFTNI